MNQRLLRNRPGSGRCGLSRLLARKITKGKPASLNCPIWCHVPSTAIQPRDTCIQLIRSLHADSCEFYPRQNKQDRWHLLQCYRVDKGAGTVTTVDKNTCQSSFFSSRAFKFFVTFSFTPHSFPFRKLIFGDIKFNIKVSVHVSFIKIS